MAAQDQGVLPVATGTITLVTIPSPFRTHQVRRQVPAGATIRDLVAIARATDIPPELGCSVVNWNEVVPEEAWDETRPDPGSLVFIRAVPRAQLAVMLVIMVVSSLVLRYQMSKLKSDLSDQLRKGRKASREITGQSNEADPYGPLPILVGEKRVYPRLAALPFTEVEGKDRFWNFLYDVGYGPLGIRDLRLGNTPIRSGAVESVGKQTSDIFDSLDYEVRLGYAGEADHTLFPSAVAEEALAVNLVRGEDVDPIWYTRRTEGEAQAFSYDITWEQGLVRFTEDGDRSKATVIIEAEYRMVGAATWTTLPEITATEKTEDPVNRSSGRIDLPAAGQYEVRLRRKSNDRGGVFVKDQATWSALRSYRFVNPVQTDAPRCTVALRIKETGQLRGQIADFNLIGISVLPDYDSGSGTWIERETTNAASIYRALYQGPWNDRPVADSRLDLTELIALHAENISFSAYWTDPGTLFERSHEVAKACEASPAYKDSLISLARDRQQTSPVQLVTTRNLIGHRMSREFPDPPHCIIGEFENRLIDWKPGERRVFDDGYNADGSGGLTAATKYERRKYPGTTDADRIWTLARRDIARQKLRFEQYDLHMRLEQLVCTRGDMIKFNSDVTLQGLGRGRVKAVTLDGGGNCTHVTLDESVNMQVAGSYGLRIRKADFSQITQPLVTDPGDQTVLQFNPAIPAASPHPEVGDLAVFGVVTEESVELIVDEVRHDSDLSAHVLCYDHATGVYSASTGTIPGYDPGISKEPKAKSSAKTFPLIGTSRGGGTDSGTAMGQRVFGTRPNSETQSQKDKNLDRGGPTLSRSKIGKVRIQFKRAPRQATSIPLKKTLA